MDPLKIMFSVCSHQIEQRRFTLSIGRGGLLLNKSYGELKEKYSQCRILNCSHGTIDQFDLKVKKEKKNVAYAFKNCQQCSALVKVLYDDYFVKNSALFKMKDIALITFMNILIQIIILR